MEKTITLPKTINSDVDETAQVDGVLREIDRRLKHMKKLDAQIERLRTKTRVALDRLKAN